MITTNTEKKTLIDRLYRDNHITLDDALVLLEEPIDILEQDVPSVQPINFGPYVPNGFIQTLPNWPSTGNPSFIPGDGTFRVSSTGITNLSGTCAVTNIVTSYPPGTTMHYTSN